MSMQQTENKHEEQLKAERQVLVELYQSCKGDEWKQRQGWVSNARIAKGEWIGVHATNCKVVSMKLVQNVLDGRLPGTLGQLHHLQVLHLQVFYASQSVSQSVSWSVSELLCSRFYTSSCASTQFWCCLK